MKLKAIVLGKNESKTYSKIFTNAKTKFKHMKQYHKFVCKNRRCKRYDIVVNALRGRYCLFCESWLKEAPRIPRIKKKKKIIEKSYPKSIKAKKHYLYPSSKDTKPKLIIPKTGQRNFSGLRLKCPRCFNTWFYQGDVMLPGTISCSKCLRKNYFEAEYNEKQNQEQPQS